MLPEGQMGEPGDDKGDAEDDKGDAEDESGAGFFSHQMHLDSSDGR